MKKWTHYHCGKSAREKFGGNIMNNKNQNQNNQSKNERTQNTQQSKTNETKQERGCK